jgi:N-acetylmuramoyl-L-alanine amidase
MTKPAPGVPVSTRTLLLLAALVAGCSSDPQPAPQPAARPAARSSAPADATPAPAPSAGESIYVAGRAVSLGAPVVVTWKDPDGYDGYQETCFFSDAQLPRSPAQGCDTPERYSQRRGLDPALAEVVAARGWTPELAAVVVDQVVVHYDVAETSRNCFRVLHDVRGLSCHFLLDVDGTLYQTLDVVERARHAAGVNDRAIGIEIAHPGPLELTQGLGARYQTGSDGQPVFDLGSRAEDPRTPNYVVRPARPTPIRGRINGQVYEQYDFTEAQYETLARLVAALRRELPRIHLEVPRDGRGQVATDALGEAELAAFQGLLGHFHTTTRKQDPGPAFDWARLLGRIQDLEREQH